MHKRTRLSAILQVLILKQLINYVKASKVINSKELKMEK